MTIHINSLKCLKSQTFSDFFPFLKGPWNKQSINITFNQMSWSVDYEYQGQKNEMTRYFKHFTLSELRKIHALNCIQVPIYHLLGGLYCNIFDLIGGLGDLFNSSRKESHLEKLKALSVIRLKMVATPIVALCLEIISFLGVLFPKEARGAFGAVERLSHYRLGLDAMFPEETTGLCETGLRVWDFQPKLIPNTSESGSNQKWNLD